VDDDGVGFDRSARCGAELGQGQALVLGLTHELAGNLELQSTTSGTSFCLMFPRADVPAQVGDAPAPSRGALRQGRRA
jgi:hypothetical protein